MEMELTECCNCGINFSVPKYWLNAKRETKAGFFCPNGRPLSYRESVADRLQREKDQLERTLQARLNEANHARLVAEKERDSERRKRRKVEVRVSKGVCPCCNRTFEDLHRHMTTKHKDYAISPGHQKQIEGTVVQ